MRTVVLAVLLAAAAMAHAQSGKPVWIIVPYAPGGGVDVYARMLAQELPAVLGQPVQVENKPGANSNIGAEYVAKSAPDGRTFMMNTNAYIINAAIYSNLSFDPLRDLVPVAILGTVPLIISVNSNVPVHSLAELVALGRKKESNLAFSSCGNGTSQHLAGELFKAMTGVDMVHVAYKGCAPAIADVAGGQVPVAFSPVSTTLPYARSGKVRPLALTTAQRSSLAPDVPSAAEAGLPGYHVDQWFALFAPGRTPRPLIDAMNDALGKVLANEEFVKKLVAQGIDSSHTSHEAALELARSDFARWGRLVRERNLKLD